MRESDTQAHAAIHNVELGQKVILIPTHCNKGSSYGDRSCQKEQLPEGRIIRVINEHYSVVEFPRGTLFAKGDFIRKTK